ncbi:MAG: hypothetical protein HY921_12540 [Elusimicrobia bacterium]|nr:hypothetical protein [Elusimicrobiota bacterium]
MRNAPRLAVLLLCATQARAVKPVSQNTGFRPILETLVPRAASSPAKPEAPASPQAPPKHRALERVAELASRTQAQFTPPPPAPSAPPEQAAAQESARFDEARPAPPEASRPQPPVAQMVQLGHHNVYTVDNTQTTINNVTTINNTPVGRVPFDGEKAKSVTFG